MGFPLKIVKRGREAITLGVIPIKSHGISSIGIGEDLLGRPYAAATHGEEILREKERRRRRGRRRGLLVVLRGLHAEKFPSNR